MAMIPDTVKQSIVERLARFQGYSEVAAAVTEESGHDVSRFQVRTYDPTNFRYAAGERWRAHFDEVRRRHLEEVGTIPIAHCAFRLNQLQELYLDAKRLGNIRQACSILRQAADEADRAGVPRPHSKPSTKPLEVQGSRGRSTAPEPKLRLIG